MNRLSKLLVVLFIASFLTGCSNYKIDVDLTPQEKQEIYAQIDEHKQAIKEWEGPEGEIPNRQITALGNEYIKLGEIGSTIRLYKSYLDDGHKTKAIIINLGRAYEKVEEYELAIEQYQRLIDEYYDREYLYDITWAHIRNKNRKQAERFFNGWQLEYQKTDLQTQQAIKKLREEEKVLKES